VKMTSTTGQLTGSGPARPVVRRFGNGRNRLSST
jgi:hypothetical protein